MIFKKNILRGVALILIAVMTVFSSVGCKSGSEVDTADCVSFTDALGRDVTVKKHPERVAALLGSFAEVWLLSGGSLCAAADDAWEDFQLDLPEAISLGGAHSPSLEALIAADPDLVIASSKTAKDVEMKDTLEAMGITVIYFNVDCFDDYLKMLKVCTDITERSDLYEKNGTEIKARIDEVKARYNDGSIPSEQKRILLLRASSSSLKAKGSSGTVLGEMLRDMGCINIADSETRLLDELSAEVIIREDPYRIFAVTMGSDTSAALASLEKNIKENPAFSGLDAVRSDRVHIMDKQYFGLKPNARWADSYEILYETLSEK